MNDYIPTSQAVFIPAHIPIDSDFAKNIALVIAEHNPLKLVETGTHEGLGSTSIIANAMNPSARLVTIESDFKLYAKAVANTRKFGHKVDCRNGLSLPISMLPTKDDIFGMLKDCPKNLNRDCPEADDLEAHAIYYLDETKAQPKQDNLLKQVVSREWGGKVDFVLLDSAGHLGWLEFTYLLNFIESPCIIALDDTNHVKHYKSMEAIRNSKVFEIIKEGDERYGWAIAYYNPQS